MFVYSANAALYWEKTGDGPPLLVLPGGTGRASLSSGIVDALKDRFTVISYDRRGMGRSRGAGHTGTTLRRHVEDATAVIAVAAEGPVRIVGTSIGAIVALELIARHPQCVAQLIVHEPPVPAYLEPGDARRADILLDTVQSTYADQGVEAGIEMLKTMLGIGPSAGAGRDTPPTPPPEFLADMDFYFAHDVTAGRSFTPDWPALRAVADRLVVAAGEESGAYWPHRCALGLAEKLALPLSLAPGGHDGPTACPDRFATWLRPLLSG